MFIENKKDNNNEVKVYLSETKLAVSDYQIGNLNLYEYQKKAVETILENKRGIFVLSAGTGMGKTAVSVAATLKGTWKRTLSIYPTNELIKNQKSSIEKLAKIMGAPDTEVVEVYRHAILEFIQEDELIHSKSQAMINLLKGQLTKNKRFLLTNPDTLHLILQLRYGSKRYRTKAPAVVLNALSDYRFLVIDEFHYYRERMLNNLLIDIYLAVAIGMFDKILLMTATPDETINDFLLRMSSFLKEKKGLSVPLYFLSQTTEENKEEKVTVTHPIDLYLKKGYWDNIETILSCVDDLKEEIKCSKKDGELVPLCIIVNSVIQARKIAFELSKEFNVVEIHGLVPQQLREIGKNTEIIVGTNAIEVGIDFDTKNLIFEANEGASFLQRLGRAGRKRPAKAWSFVPEYVYNYVTRRVKDAISKEKFAELIQDAYMEKPQRYLCSSYAAYEVKVYLEKFKEEIAKSKVAESTVDIENLFKLMEFVFKLNNSNQLRPKPELAIIDEKRDTIVMFRNGEPQVLVYDISAEKNGLFPLYFSPVSRIIYRAEKILEIKVGLEISKHIYKKMIQTKNEKEKTALKYTLIDLKEQSKRREKNVMVKISGYLKKRRRAQFRYIERISMSEPIVGVNEDKLGYDLELTTTSEVERLGMMFEDQLYAIIPKGYTKGLDWRYTNYEATSMENQNKGQVFFGADCLIGLAYMEAIKNEENGENKK